MKIDEIIKKAATGADLTDEEKAELAKFDPNAGKNELAAVKTELDKFKADLAAITKERDEAKKAIDEAKRATMSDGEKAAAELEALRKEKDDLTKARETAEAELGKLKRSAAVNAIAAKHGFEDVTYLDHLLASANVDVTDDNAATTYMTKAKTDMPKFFKSSVPAGPPAPKAEEKAQPMLRPGNLVDVAMAALKDAPTTDV